MKNPLLYFFLERYKKSFIAEMKEFMQSIRENTFPQSTASMGASRSLWGRRRKKRSWNIGRSMERDCGPPSSAWLSLSCRKLRNQIIAVAPVGITPGLARHIRCCCSPMVAWTGCQARGLRQSPLQGKRRGCSCGCDSRSTEECCHRREAQHLRTQCRRERQPYPPRQTYRRHVAAAQACRR